MEVARVSLGRRCISYGKEGKRLLMDGKEPGEFQKRQRIIMKPKETLCLNWSVLQRRKTSLPSVLKTLEEGKLTFLSSKFAVVLFTLDKRIREMLTEKYLTRYPKKPYEADKTISCSR